MSLRAAAEVELDTFNSPGFISAAASDLTTDSRSRFSLGAIDATQASFLPERTSKLAPAKYPCHMP